MVALAHRARRRLPISAPTGVGFFAMRRSAHRTHLAGLLALLAACGGGERGATTRAPLPPARRIVSLSPAVTELLYALGAGDRVVGRTTWCDYPPAVRAVPSVGDGLSPNLEAIVARRPDLVVLYRSALNETAAQRLRALGLATAVLPQDRLEDLAAAAGVLGRLPGRSAARGRRRRRAAAAARRWGGSDAMRWLGLGLAAVLALGLALVLGPTPVPWAALGSSDIVRELRLPRALLAFLVGGGLRLAGAALQALVRNPLADPFLLGLSGGAGLGAVLAIATHLSGPWTLPLAAFAGALAALALVYRLGLAGGAELDPRALILGGVAVGAFAGAVTTAIVSLASAVELRNALLWLWGGV